MRSKRLAGWVLWGCFSLCAQERPAGPAFTKDQILRMVGSTQMLEEDQIVESVKARGVDFPVNEAFLKTLRHAEAGEALIAAMARTPMEKGVELPPPLDVPGRAGLLEQARKKALSYAANLPNFNCLQTTKRQQDFSAKGNWSTLDVIQLQVAYDSQNGESYQLTKGKYEALTGAISKGEFGSLMLGVFGFIAEAKFEWERQSLVRGRATEVFGYSVRKVNSQWRITYQKGTNQPAFSPGRGGLPNLGARQLAIAAEVVAAYRGHVWVDRSTHEVLRITMIAVDLPAGYPIQAAGTLVDYDHVDLSGYRFLMPKRALVLMQEGGIIKRNQLDFSQYQKFTTDTKISFDPPPRQPQ